MTDPIICQCRKTIEAFLINPYDRARLPKRYTVLHGVEYLNKDGKVFRAPTSMTYAQSKLAIKSHLEGS